MIGIDELKSLMSRISYARLLKDVKKAGINVAKLRMPEKDIGSQLISARVRPMFKAVFGQIKARVTKERYCYKWYVWMEELEKMYRENHYEFYKFFNAHPDMKKLEEKYDFSFSSGQHFTVFEECERGHNNHILEYNSQLLEELGRYKEYVSAVLSIYPEIKRQWMEHQKRTVQQKYDAIAARKARGERK
jgi:hypothetical protein